MKLLAFVDLHASKKAFKSIRKKIRKHHPDFIICAGDFTIFEQDIDKMMKKLSKLGLDIFLVHGNHEEEKLTKKIAKQHKNIRFIHNRTFVYRGLVFIGWGGGGFTEKDIEFENFAKKIDEKIKNYKKKNRKFILVSHAPFYNTKLDSLMDEHLGNKSMTSFIKKHNIDLGICGHFHENAGKEDNIKQCRVYNPGPTGRIITI